MAFPTAVNDQITDSVSQANLNVVGDGPAMALSNLFIVTSQALSNAAHNTSLSNQQSILTSQAANVQGVSTLHSMDTASTGTETTAILGLGTYSKGQG